jgi:hypothetical protein
LIIKNNGLSSTKIQEQSLEIKFIFQKTWLTGQLKKMNVSDKDEFVAIELKRDVLLGLLQCE